MKTKLNNQPDAGGYITLIGPRASGKNCYLSLLSIWNQQNSKNVIEVSCYNGQELKRKAENVLLQGSQLAATVFRSNVEENPSNDFNIKIKKRNFFHTKELIFNISIRFYVGEFFDGFPVDDFLDNFPIYKDYLKHSIIAKNGYLFLVDGSSYEMDKSNSRSLEKLLEGITELWPYDIFTKPRFAFALSKCELSDLYVNRDDPRGMVTRRFPKMQEILETWAAQGYGEVGYFATSAFGVFGEYSEPNSTILRRYKSGTMAVIKNPSEWKPFGLVEPLYWLCTGKHL